MVTPIENIEKFWGTESDLSTRLEELKQKADKAATKKFDVQEYGEKTRRGITFYLLTGLFALIIIGFLFCYFYNKMLLDKYQATTPTELASMKDTLVSIKDVVYPITSIFGTALGFTIAYYFKESGK